MKVIVTGASRGIGRGIASFLGKDGHTVALLARSADLLAEVLESIRKQGGEGCCVPCDLRNPESVTKGIAQAIDQLGGVDALINNAGLVIRKDVFSIEPDEWRDMMDTNVNGLFYATRAVLPTMREQGYGHIVNISSISGHVPLPGGSAYAASKFAVSGFSQSLFQEVRDYGIKVTTIYPGSVDSESHRHEPDADHSWKVQPEEVGQAVRDLLQTSPTTVISELEIRPLGRPPQK